MTTFLKVRNRSFSKLSVACLAGDGTITLVSVATFPVTFPFHVTIDDEILSCTGVGGANIFNVIRAQEGTVAADHAVNSVTELNVTAQLISDLDTAVNTAETNITTINGNIVTINNTIAVMENDTIAMAIALG